MDEIRVNKRVRIEELKGATVVNKNYDSLKNKPSIEGFIIEGNKAASDYNLATLDDLERIEAVDPEAIKDAVEEYLSSNEIEIGKSIDAANIEPNGDLILTLVDGSTINCGNVVGRDGVDGSDGDSAYEIAINNGFEGSEEEWISSLQGKNGIDGKSAYEIAIENGFEGNEEEWVESLNGYSPTVSISEEYDGYTITITDVNGEHSFKIVDSTKSNVDTVITEDGVTLVVPESAVTVDDDTVILDGRFFSGLDIGTDNITLHTDNSSSESSVNIIDDTAGDGDTNKTWSADKLHNEFGKCLTEVAFSDLTDTPSYSSADSGKTLTVKDNGTLSWEQTKSSAVIDNTFVVSMTGNVSDASTLNIDKTPQQIYEAHNEGKTILCTLNEFIILQIMGIEQNATYFIAHVPLIDELWYIVVGSVDGTIKNETYGISLPTTKSASKGQLLSVDAERNFVWVDSKTIVDVEEIAEQAAALIDTSLSNAIGSGVLE